MRPKTQRMGAVAVVLLLSLVCALICGTYAPVRAQEGGGATGSSGELGAETTGDLGAGSPGDLGAVVEIPHRAPTEDPFLLVAQAENSAEVSVSTEEELRQAVKAATKDATIVLGSDIALASSSQLYVTRGQAFTLNLHGHTLSRAPGSGNSRIISIDADATLSIVDLPQGGHGTISGGRSYNDGGAISNNGTLVMYGGTITGSSAVRNGGAVANYGSASFKGTTIAGNTAGRRGGGIYNAGYATLLFDGGSLSNNTATEGGGGLYNWRDGNSIGSCVFSSCVISQNKVTNGDGGGIYDLAQGNVGNNFTISFASVRLIGNTASGRGGGVYARFEADDSKLTPTSPLTIDGGTMVQGNVAGAEGGGIYIGPSYRAAITNATIKKNKTGANGGGIYVDGSDAGNLSMENYVFVKDNELETGSEEGDKPNNLYFGSPENFIAVTGPFGRSANVVVTLDPTTLYRTVTMGYAENAKITDASGNEVEARDPSGIFHGDGDHVALLRDDEVKVVTRVHYMDLLGDTSTVIDYEQVTSAFTGNKGTDEWGDWFVVYQDVELAERPSFEAKSSLIVYDGATLTCNKGIEVPRAGSLTIYGQKDQSGAIVADARFLGATAGIGSSDGRTAGEITINGAHVQAAGGKEGAGIGCGGNQAANLHDNVSGPFTLNRGNVSASGGWKGAGVGHGLANYDGSGSDRTVSEWSSGFHIYIHGGQLVAVGGEDGPGLGVTNDAGFTLRVDGGDVLAMGGTGGAGIGSAGGYVCYDESNLTFAGGTVRAIGGTHMVGIGCMDRNFKSYYGGNKIVFSGGVVEAIKGSYSPAPLGGKYEASWQDTMLLAGSSERDAQRVPAQDRWSAMRESYYEYVRVEPCDHMDAVAVYDSRGLWRLDCAWCQREGMGSGYPIHYEPGEGTGTMKDDFVTSYAGHSVSFKLPKTTTFVPPEGKELAGWRMGGDLYEPGATIQVSGSVTVEAVWKAAGSSATPGDVAVPAHVTATFGQRLSEVGLPNPEGNADGLWAWDDPTQMVGDVGERSFKATFTPVDVVGHGSVASVDVPVTVNKAANPAAAGGRVAVRRGGESVDLSGCVEACGAEGGVSYRIAGDALGCTLEGSVLASGSELGTLTVEVTVAEDRNRLASAPMAIEVEVTDKETQTLAFGGGLVSATYGDGPLSNPLSGARSAVTYASSDPSVAEVAVDGAVTVVGAGRTVITATAEGTDEVAGASAFYVLEVGKAPCTVTAPVAVGDLVADGEARELVTGGSAEGGRMQYALGAESGPSQAYGDSVPTATEAGTYHVWYCAKGDGNHLDTAPARVDTVIAASPLDPLPEDEPSQVDPSPEDPSPVVVGPLMLAGDCHLQTLGDVAATASGVGVLLGTTGQARRLEALALTLPDGVVGSIEYRSHLQSTGWERDWVADGTVSGTVGEARRVEAVQVRLSGVVAETHSVWYRVHSQTWGWLGWAHDGQAAGTAGQAKRAEAVEVRVLPKGQVPEGYAGGRRLDGYAEGQYPGRYAGCQASYVGAAVGAAHLQGTGWTRWGESLAFGTTGQARRLEAIRFALANQPLTGGIEYAAHVQGIGWQEAASDGAVAGTTGESRRMEAVRVSLTGEMAAVYSVWYRVHSQTWGWLGWAHDGEDAGTTGLAKRAEAIEVQVLPAGQVPAGYDPDVDACVVGL